MNTGKIVGEYYEEISLGYNIFPLIDLFKEFSSEDWYNFRLDVVCVLGNTNVLQKLSGQDWIYYAQDVLSCNQKSVWLFEVEKKLNPTAIGQILIYDTLFKMDWPFVNVKGKGIICGRANAKIEAACIANDIEVFEV